MAKVNNWLSRVQYGAYLTRETEIAENAENNRAILNATNRGLTVSKVEFSRVAKEIKPETLDKTRFFAYFIGVNGVAYCYPIHKSAEKYLQARALKYTKTENGHKRGDIYYVNGWYAVNVSEL